MKKLFNFRSFVYSTVLIMLSVLSCVLAMNIAWLGLALLITVIFIPIIVLVVLRKKIADYQIVTVIMTTVLCIISSVSLMIKAYTWIPYDIVQDNDYYIEGTVENWHESDGFKVVILKDLTIGTRNVPGNMSLDLFNGNEFDDNYVGYRLKFTSDLQLNMLISENKINSTILQSDIRYRTAANFNNIEFYAMRPDILSSVNIFIKNKLIDNMGKNGSVAYGMLTGSKYGIPDEIRDSFTIAGVAHILAVSGLHIGFLMSLIMSVLKLFKVRRKPSFFISVGVLLLYAFLAGFSPSVTRAVIMCIVGGGALVLGEQKDSLNSLGLAATTILTFAPLMLFDAGFIMSMGAVFAIINFTPVFTRGFTKLGLHEKLCGALSVSLSAQLGILPASICIFGRLQTYSVLINVVLMPLMSFAFIVTFVMLLISVIIPLFGFLLCVVGAIIEVLITSTSFCATLPFAQIEIYSSWIVMLLYPFYFTIGDFCNSEHKRAIAYVGAIIAILFVLFLILI